jgi:hypothetical protein
MDFRKRTVAKESYTPYNVLSFGYHRNMFGVDV